MLKVRSGVFIVNFEHISHLVLRFLLLTLNMSLPAGIQRNAWYSLVGMTYDVNNGFYLLACYVNLQ